MISIYVFLHSFYSRFPSCAIKVFTLAAYHLWLTEALGLSQPGNGSLLATHADRKQLFLNAGSRIVELTKRYYEQDDASALPRNIASKAAFENAMSPLSITTLPRR